MSEMQTKISFKLPHNTLAEQLVLGSMCLDKSTIPIVLQKLPLDSFYLSEHKILYKSILDLYHVDTKFDLTQVTSYLQEKGILEDIGGIEFITNIISKVVTTINLENYIILLQEKYFRRLLILLGKSIIEASYDQKKDLEELLLEIESQIYTITSKRLNDSLESTTEILNSVLLDVQWKFQNVKNSLGLKTSYNDLDALTQGFQNSELIIIAGRPSMGKTAFSLNLARNIVDNYKISILIFSLEMSKQQLIYRFLSMLTGINLIKLRSGNLTTLEWNLFQEAIQILAKKSIYIDDDSYINLKEIQIKSRQMLQKKDKLGLIIIDYLQLMQVNTKNDNRAQELAYITRTLKILAKELNIPIIILSQLSRNVESRIDKRPILSDLRDSGCFASQTFKIRKLLKKNYLLSNSLVKNIIFTGHKPIYDNYQFSSQIQISNKHKLFFNKGWKNLRDSYFIEMSAVFSLGGNSFWLQKQNSYYKIIDLVYDINLVGIPTYLFKYQLFHNSIEQDADIVLMLYRDDYYNSQQNTNITELIIAKHRNGPLGIVKLLFDKNSLQFANCSKEAAIS